jgi:hypothetical protein
MRKTSGSIAVLLFFFTSVNATLTPIHSAWAAAATGPEIPKKPSAPPSLSTRKPTDSFRCQRFYVYQGKRIACDSNIKLDGENLRPLMEDVPQAIAELNLYQTNRLKARSAAYWGTVGLLVMIGGSLLSLRYRDQGNPTDTSNTIRTISLFGGGGIMIGSFISALSFIKTNETHIGNAVNFYNQAHPEAPIQLQFNTAISF